MQIEDLGFCEKGAAPEFIRRHTFTRPVWHTPAPKLWPPSISYGEARTVALDVLPGARFERLPYLRYGLTWTRPDDDNP